MLISEPQILEVLRRQNYWWGTGRVSSDIVPEFKRTSFYEILSLLETPELKRAIVLSGARRVGKTVILHQLAQHAISARRTSPKKILYVTFEDLTLTQANLREILDLYERNIEPIDEKTIILLDEIHYTKDWSRWLMTALRDFPKTRFVATGSAAVLLRDVQINESGVGRWVSVHVPTLSFYEYVQLSRQQTIRFSFQLDLASLAKTDEKQRQEILSACQPLERDFNRYLLQGGFPAMISPNLTLPLAQRLLREDVIDKALKRDMAHLYGVRSLSELDQIFVYLCFNMGAIVEKNTLAKEMDRTAASTVESHLQRLEDAHLIYRLPPFHLEGKKSLKPRSKVYVADPSLRNAVLLRGEGLFENETELGGVVEACIFKHLYAFYFPKRPWYGYWRNPKNEKEVDFVIRFPDNSLAAFEIKYREDPRLNPKDGLMELMNIGTPPKPAYLITKRVSDFGPIRDTGIFQIPAFLFSYLIGYIELQERRGFTVLKSFGDYGQESATMTADVIEELPRTEKKES